MPRSRTRVFAVLTAIGMLPLGGPGTVVAADPSSGLAGTLLVAGDMPDGLLPRGVLPSSDFDIDGASYESNGGLEIATQTWNREAIHGTEAVAVAIDFRMLFPDEAAAQAYLDAAEPILSESVTGLTLQPETPAISEVVRRYAGTIEGSGLSAEVQNFLMREGPVVSKLYILGFGTTMDDALPIAQAAADRTAAWVAQLPVASPGTESPAASVVTATEAPSVAPSAEPDASSGASASVAPSGAVLQQWAVGATASSQYGDPSWSAMQATGAPDVDSYMDDQRAWASANGDGSVEWLELTYAQAVVPSAVEIIEVYNNGDVVLVEAFDAADDAWVTLWSGNDPSPPDVIATFSPPLASVDFATDRLRITLGDIVPGWNEIDAVQLEGTVP